MADLGDVGHLQQALALFREDQTLAAFRHLQCIKALDTAVETLLASSSTGTEAGAGAGGVDTSKLNADAIRRKVAAIEAEAADVLSIRAQTMTAERAGDEADNGSSESAGAAGGGAVDCTGARWVLKRSWMESKTLILETPVDAEGNYPKSKVQKDADALVAKEDPEVGCDALVTKEDPEVGSEAVLILPVVSGKLMAFGPTRP